MKILFMTFGTINSIFEHTIYCDLLREFINQGHFVNVLCPGNLNSIDGERYTIKYVNLDIVRGSKNFIKKGFSTLFAEKAYVKALKNYYSNEKFDLVLYSTPPITLYKAVEYIKKRDNAITYLLLKDIFPQNAIDLGLMNLSGIKGIIYSFFRKKEKKLYNISDYIGCMSPANVEYIVKHNNVSPQNVEVCPNSIEIIDKSVSAKNRDEIRKKYSIPLDKKVFIYGGNLGKPQGIPFIIECISKCKDLKDAYFLIVGDGSEYCLLEDFVNCNHPDNFMLLKKLPKEDYDTIVGACDVGMIFLDYRFTIPNFPSRILSYMQAKLPVLSCTDEVTDIGMIAKNEGFGWNCKSNDVEGFYNLIETILEEDLIIMGKKSFLFLNDNYSVQKSYKIIMKHINNYKPISNKE